MAKVVLSPTLTGLVDLANPDPATITIEALARGLCRPRWANATELPITIAQHSVLVMELFIRRNPALRLAAIYPLLHDAHEYLLGDLITPTVRLLAEDLPGLPARIDRHKGRIDAVIRLALGVPAPDTGILALVHEADQAAAHVEWISLIPSVNGHSPFTTPRKSLFRMPTIKPLAWPQAEALFRETLERELAMKPWHAVPMEAEGLPA